MLERGMQANPLSLPIARKGQVARHDDHGYAGRKRRIVKPMCRWLERADVSSQELPAALPSSSDRGRTGWTGAGRRNSRRSPAALQHLDELESRPDTLGHPGEGCGCGSRRRCRRSGRAGVAQLPQKHVIARVEVAHDLRRAEQLQDRLREVGEVAEIAVMTLQDVPQVVGVQLKRLLEREQQERMPRLGVVAPREGGSRPHAGRPGLRLRPGAARHRGRPSF